MKFFKKGSFILFLLGDGKIEVIGKPEFDRKTKTSKGKNVEKETDKMSKIKMSNGNNAENKMSKY